MRSSSTSRSSTTASADIQHWACLPQSSSRLGIRQRQWPDIQQLDSTKLRAGQSLHDSQYGSICGSYLRCATDCVGLERYGTGPGRRYDAYCRPACGGAARDVRRRLGNRSPSRAALSDGRSTTEQLAARAGRGDWAEADASRGTITGLRSAACNDCGRTDAACCADSPGTEAHCLRGQAQDGEFVRFVRVPRTRARLGGAVGDQWEGSPTFSDWAQLLSALQRIYDDVSRLAQA
jgi:hypothetical protein